MPDFSYLENLTDAELEALRLQVAARTNVCVPEVNDLQDALDQAQQAEQDAQQNYDDAVEDANQQPSVEGETSVKNGGTGPDVVEYIAVDIPVGASISTGNGDDGLGIITSWDVPEELRVNFNVLAFVSGEKVSSGAQLLEVDYIGSIPDFQDSVLVSDEGIIIPDLFDPNAERNPDKTFFVETGPKAFDQVFTVKVFAPQPDQIFDITTFAKPADQIFDITTIETYGVSAAELPFIVEVGPELPNQIFSVKTSATPPDRTFVVQRGPGVPDQTFEVLPITKFTFKTGVAIPDRTYFVELGPAPAKTPDQIFGVSVGGPDAPPIPDPDEIFEVETSWATPDKIFRTNIITNRVVDVFEAPFLVTVGPNSPDQIFDVTSSAKPFDQVFSVEVGPEIPSQVFETTIINEFEVDAYSRPLTYQIQEGTINNQTDYIVSGEGLEFANEPTINVEVGQELRLFVNTPANALWIKDVQEDGPGELEPFFADITNQGTTNRLMKARFWQVGTYYYQSEFNASASGIIEVTGVSAENPDQIFDVFVGAGQEQDQTFEITTGPEFPDEIFSVTAEGGAPPVHKNFETVVGPEIPTENFEVLTALPALTYTIQNSGNVAYLVTGNGLTSEPNADFNLEVGQMLELGMDAAGHPLYISDTDTSGVKNANTAYFHDMVGQGSALGVVRVIFSQPGTYFYNCGFHAGMGGQINVTGTGMDQKVYALGQGQNQFALTGEGLLNEGNPTLTVNLGETLYLSVLTVDQPVYIKREPGVGVEVQEPDFMQLLVNQGTTDSLMKMRFLLPGTYYYASSVNQNFGGVIEVLG